MSKSGVKIKPSHKGLLRKELGVPEGQKIPAKKLNAAAKNASPAEKKRIVFAQNAKHWSK